MTREEHDKAMDALGAEWAECADCLRDAKLMRRECPQRFLPKNLNR